MVTCENCNTEYTYLLRRMGHGSAVSSLLSLLDYRVWRAGGASELADERAQKSLRKALLRDVEPALCPTCGALQSDMEDALKQKIRWQYREKMICPAVCLLSGSGFAVFIAHQLHSWEMMNVISILSPMMVFTAFWTAVGLERLKG